MFGQYSSDMARWHGQVQDPQPLSDIFRGLRDASSHVLPRKRKSKQSQGWKRMTRRAGTKCPSASAPASQAVRRSAHAGRSYVPSRSPMPVDIRALGIPRLGARIHGCCRLLCSSVVDGRPGFDLHSDHRYQHVPAVAAHRSMTYANVRLPECDLRMTGGVPLDRRLHNAAPIL